MTSLTQSEWMFSRVWRYLIEPSFFDLKIKTLPANIIYWSSMTWSYIAREKCQKWRHIQNLLHRQEDVDTCTKGQQNHNFKSIIAANLWCLMPAGHAFGCRIDIADDGLHWTGRLLQPQHCWNQSAEPAWFYHVRAAQWRWYTTHRETHMHRWWCPWVLAWWLRVLHLM